MTKQDHINSLINEMAAHSITITDIKHGGALRLRRLV